MPPWVEGEDKLLGSRGKALAKLGDRRGKELLTRLSLQETTIFEGINLGDHALSEVHEVDIRRTIVVFIEAEDVDIVYVMGGYGMLDLVVL